MSRVLSTALSRALVGAALVAGASRVAAAQQPVATSMPVAASLSERLPAPAYDAVARLLDSAGRAGLPTMPLVNKALEGAAKRADAERIVSSTRALAADLGRARAALGRDASDAEVTAGATALRAGVKPDALRALRRRPGRQPVTLALGGVLDLVARGVPADTAVLAVQRLDDDAQLALVERAVERDVALGAPAGASALARVAEFLGSRATAAGPIPASADAAVPVRPSRRRP